MKKYGVRKSIQVVVKCYKYLFSQIQNVKISYFNRLKIYRIVHVLFKMKKKIVIKKKILNGIKKWNVLKSCQKPSMTKMLENQSILG